jgi:hypothetical protein
MARKTKATGPNAGSRKADARKRHVCQLCGDKTMPAKAKSVIVDPPGIGEVSVVKSREGKSYWCGTCAKKKKASYERAIANKRANGAKPKSRKTTGKKATKATAKKTRTAPKRKRTPAKAKGSGSPAARRRERTRKSIAGEPF